MREILDVGPVLLLQRVFCGASVVSFPGNLDRWDRKLTEMRKGADLLETHVCRVDVSEPEFRLRVVVYKIVAARAIGVVAGRNVQFAGMWQLPLIVGCKLVNRLCCGRDFVKDRPALHLAIGDDVEYGVMIVYRSLRVCVPDPRAEERLGDRYDGMALFSLPTQKDTGGYIQLKIVCAVWHNIG